MMQTLALSKNTIIKSVLFVTIFWFLVGILMYGLYQLFHYADISAVIQGLITQLLRA